MAHPTITLVNRLLIKVSIVSAAVRPIRIL